MKGILRLCSGSMQHKTKSASVSVDTSDFFFFFFLLRFPW